MEDLSLQNAILLDSDPNLEEIERCFHWSNMHPLEKTENMKKSNKIIPELIDKKQKMAEEFKKSYIQ